ncbi:LysR substrate-binding domain-containing protein [Caballeronia sp. LP006]|uniref:LysR substrate-binding domain-containing protein n=1 Tax=Caballeronia sp. LP006 TaxID=3038552 RepID=UPI002860904B|nr:LysR substrate-binding domain-containing protein [Caballeronia sp. LP006]MDR5832332.1 LysR substrate-binding domain-containing protein [Caballeronia sp. LP006]
MELKQLEAFVHVVELGSFTRAATILDTNQPTLSRLVRQLEVELRQTLLVRHGRGVVASDAGQVMLGHAKGMLLQAERARHDLRQLQGAVGGHFSVGLAPSFAKIATQELIRQFRQQFPEATISVAEGLSTYLTEWLMMGRLDAAVLYDTSLTALVEKRAVFEEELFLIGIAGEKGAEAPKQIRLKDIPRYPLVIPGRMHALRQIVEARAAEEGVKLTIALEVDAVGAILDLVCEGYGYAVLPINATATDPLRRPFSVTRIRQPTLHSRLTIATSSQHTLSHLAMEAIGLIESVVLPLYTADRNPGLTRVEKT